jgi:hypothetical protein
MIRNEANHFTVGRGGLAVVTYAVYLVFDRLLCQTVFLSLRSPFVLQHLGVCDLQFGHNRHLSESA